MTMYCDVWGCCLLPVGQAGRQNPCCVFWEVSEYTGPRERERERERSTVSLD